MASPKGDSIACGLKAWARRWPELRSKSEDDPVFILAAGWRSGSTLLQRMVMPHCLVWGEPYGHSWLVDSLADPLRSLTHDWPEPHFFHRGQSQNDLSQRFCANLYPPAENLLRAHLRFFDTLFAQPARDAGARRWGLKEVRLTADHAIYLKWLFPRAKFLFLYRNPYDCFRSYLARRDSGWKWFNHWPDKPLTVSGFGRHWRTLVGSFLKCHEQVGGLVVRYESLAKGEISSIEEYLGFDLSKAALEVNPSDSGPPPVESIPDPELVALQREIGDYAAKLGYRHDLSEDEVPTRPAATRTPSDSDSSIVVGAATNLQLNLSPSATDNGKCMTLVPVGSQIEPQCDEGLRTLEQRGYVVRRVRGYAAIDQGRNQMATNALMDGANETMWIDSDVGFSPDDVDRLRSHNLPIVCGIYPKKGQRALSCHLLPETEHLKFGDGGGLVEILYAAAGFLLVRREVYIEIQRQLGLEFCNERFGRPMVPFFQPMIVPTSEGDWYLAEDYAFCERARRCGFKIYADTTIRLRHYGVYGYSWEDAGNDTQRFATYNFRVR